MWGDVLTFVMTVAYAAMLVVLRKHREVTMISAAWLSALLGVAVTLPLATPTAVGGRNLLHLALFGTIQMGRCRRRQRSAAGPSSSLRSSATSPPRAGR